MSGRREILRNRARTRRSVAKCLAAQKATDQHHRIQATIDQTCSIVSNECFLALLRRARIVSVPCLLNIENSNHIDTPCLDRTPDGFDNSMMDFMVAWKFMSPLFDDAKFVEYFETAWPGFIGNMKDVFISIVTSGPFPNERKHSQRLSPLSSNLVC